VLQLAEGCGGGGGRDIVGRVLVQARRRWRWRWRWWVCCRVCGRLNGVP
jgi:hypothetical protein